MENKCKHLCSTCQRCSSVNTKYACVIDHMTLLPLKYPEMDLNECIYYMPIAQLEMNIDTGNIDEENKAELNYIEKNKDNLDKMENFEPHVEELPQINIINKETGKTLTDEEYETWKENLYKKMDVVEQFKERFYKAYGLKITKDGKVVDKDIETPEDMLLGDIKLDHLEQITSWKRVLNAARRTVGKEYLDKEPSLSWKAKVLLAEHSPIRLLEYDFGWRKIRQWVTAHLVRHHEGCEKFVHSQRGDRRELPCDRDHIYQGAKNDMDMTCNAQAMINISRKRLCNCASKETREAWKLVMGELKIVDPILANKCVPECVYRGFCPELNSCGYWKTVQFKKDLAEYRRTKYGDKRKFYVINEGEGRLQCIVENTGHIYKLPKLPFESKTGELDYDTFVIYAQYAQVEEYKYEMHSLYGENGAEPCITEPSIIPVSSLVYACFTDEIFYSGVRTATGMPDIMPKGERINHIDGNVYNNDIDNLINISTEKGENRKFYAINKGQGKLQVLVENTGHIYELPKDNFGKLLPTGEVLYEGIKDYPLVELKYEKHKWHNGLEELCITNPIIPVMSLVYYCFGNDLIVYGKDDNLVHIDGNIYNNDIDNLDNININKGEA